MARFAVRLVPRSVGMERLKNVETYLKAPFLRQQQEMLEETMPGETVYHKKLQQQQQRTVELKSFSGTVVCSVCPVAGRVIHLCRYRNQIQDGDALVQTPRLTGRRGAGSRTLTPH